MSWQVRNVGRATSIFFRVPVRRGQFDDTYWVDNGLQNIRRALPSTPLEHMWSKLSEWRTVRLPMTSRGVWDHVDKLEHEGIERTMRCRGRCL